jgi:hypothetical protein
MKTKILFRGLILGIIVTSLFTNNLIAQYSTGIGLRIGGTTGLDVKHFYKPSKAFEGIIGTFGNGISFTGLIEKYSPIYDAPGLYVYYGGGAHLAFYDGRGEYYSRFGREINYYKNNDVGLGINGIVGLEYRLPDGIPISFSLDLKPFIELGTGGYVGFAPDPSLGVKFIIR